MRKLYLTALFLLSSALGIAQTIEFEYDNSGNQITRELCLTCEPPGRGISDIKQIEEVSKEEYQTFFEGDSFSYYPNPVREELYLKWLDDSLELTEVTVYDAAGVRLQSLSDRKVKTEFTLSFGMLPVGNYLVVPTVLFSEGQA